MALGVDAFNRQCRQMVLTYVAEWRKTITRLGRWVDFDNDYKTMDTTFMESVWWVFKRLWDKDRIYKSYRIMPYSYKLTTPLSNFEANSNYKQVQDPAITVAFRVTAGCERLGASDVYLLAWTTTPWTLPSNLALCVGPDITYVVARDAASGASYVLAEARLAEYEKVHPGLVVETRLRGAELAGVGYEPLFPYFASHARSFVVLSDAFVSTAFRPGISARSASSRSSRVSTSSSSMSWMNSRYSSGATSWFASSPESVVPYSAQYRRRSASTSPAAMPIRSSR